MNDAVVIDTNLVFSALVSRRARLRELLLTEPGLRLLCPRFLFVELFKHKERIVRATELPEEELLEFLNALLTRVEFVDEAAIPMGTWMEARRLCRETDAKDIAFIALALHLKCRLWSGDEELKQGLRAKGFHSFFEP
ncbi:MAG: hypothetical protein RL514_858 [Verrucomicrobiota bacterium]